MNFDWAVSLFVVSFIVFGLIIVEEIEFSTFEHAYASQTVTSSIASTITDKVNRIEGIAANTSESFEYGGSSGGAIFLPADLNGQPYTVDLTHDYAIILTTGGTPVGTAINFWEPVYLFNLTTMHLLANAPVNGTWLQGQASLPASICENFPSGLDFLVTHELSLVDGHPEYLTVISSANGQDYPCT